MGLVFLLLVWRSFYGINYMDESFYMSLAHRLYTGDKLVVDEWHPTQFYSFILLPFYALFRFFSKDAQGVVLFFRVLNLIFAFITSVFVMRRIEEEGEAGSFSAVSAALPLFLYAKSNNLGPGYYNLCIYFITLAILALTGKGGRGGKAQADKTGFRLLGAGVLTAMGVICMPFMAVPVILYCLFGLSKGRRILYYMGGLILSALVYIPVCFPLGRLPEVMANFPCIFLDPEHKQGFFKYLENTWRSYKLFFVNEYILYALLAITLLMIILGLAGKLPGYGFRTALFIVCMGAAVFHSIYKLHRYPGLASIAFTMWMMPVMVINIFEKRFSRLCTYLSVGGAALALCFAGGSDTGFSSLTTGYTIWVIAAVINADVFVRQLCHKEAFHKENAMVSSKELKAFFVLAMTLILLVMMAQRIFMVFRDSDLENLTAKITRGPMAGLYTTEQHKESYDKVCEFLHQLPEKEGGSRVFFSRMLPWGYLCVPYGFGAPTAWRTQIDSPLLESYYLLHPDSIPDVVVVMKPQVGAFDRNEFSRIDASQTPNKNNLDGWFYDYMLQEGYVSREYEVATVWRR